MFGLGISRFLPPALHGPVRVLSETGQRLTNGARIAFATQRRRAPKRYAGTRVAVLGFTEAPTGLGRGARLMLAEFAATGVEARGFDAAPLLLFARRAEARATLDALAAYAPSDIVMHLNPPVFENAYLRLPGALTRSATIIGYWAWELNRLPALWAKRAPICDEIWAPSPFVADAVRASAPHFEGAVRVYPHAVARDPFPRNTPEGRAAARAKLGVPSDAFVAGLSFSMSSNFARKNPLAAVAAFTQAFPDAPDARLLVRLLDPDDYPRGHAELQAHAARDQRIRIIERADAGIAEFYQALDVLISLHRSEGYGLNIAEATQAGLDVVATAWSISPELLAPPNVRAIGSTLVKVDDPQGVYSAIEGAQWAEANIDEAAAALTALHAARRARV